MAQVDRLMAPLTVERAKRMSPEEAAAYLRAYGHILPPMTKIALSVRLAMGELRA